MARELKAGDRLRSVDGMVEMKSIEDDKTQPVYNLDVASDHTYFVGNQDYLVHDNTYPQSSTALFDASPGAEPVKSARD